MTRNEVLEMARQCKALTGFESEIEFIERFAALVADRTARKVPEGCVVVPREPTSIQINAAIYGGGKYATIYKAMIAAGEVKP